MNAQRPYDLILFGATGYTGGLTAEYLAQHAPPETRWALAGRNRAKLEAVRARLAALNPACAGLELLAADSSDADGLLRLAQSARVLVSTVGPYILHGAPLVAACARAGTHYADLTGEPEFVDRMWLAHHAEAENSGAKLVHCCGFDSIPHDLGVYYTVQQLPPGVPLQVEGYVRARGQFSAGTYHSAINAFARLRQYRQVRQERRARERWPDERRIGSTAQRIRYDRELGCWLVPFPTIDPQVVRRSAALLERYGPDFRYGHYVQVKKFANVAALLGGAGALLALAQLPPARRWLLGRKSSGEGPTPEQRARGKFSVRFVGRGGGVRVVTEVSGGDPGYGETAKMLCESALCLAFDPLPPRAGQLTPAAAMGEALLARLQRAGIRFEVLENVRE
ncbi:MAG: saccharopine dehydrogenase NADP-binding domain-containing protein [Nevskia sp.]|nr:saccharopine dehydrogenase NADP-binding domain-containing protein [Nevskia sp.]